ncbi:MAG: 16S rRNA (guanine(527)-N(7))-methyltransferase RsmG [Anaerovoracaceae bacterium]|jgi:16S rRNA (guanine527-N7)-methyltransferase
MSDVVEKALRLLGIDDIEEKAVLMRRYKEAVLDWNKKVNLTTIPTEEFDIKHTVDSLMIAGEECMRDSSVIMDIGTGAGFPGVPLAIAFPEKQFTLVDSLNKRVNIIRQTVDNLGISNVRTVHSRAEDLGRNGEWRESCDLVISRAVADMTVLSEYCLPLVKPGGFFAAYKGPESVHEIREASHAVDILGGGEPVTVVPEIAGKIEEYDLDHILVIIKKEKPTPKKFPRKAGTPSKDPIR